MTVLKRAAALLVAVITMSGATELGEHLYVQGVPGFVSTRGGRCRPATDTGQRGRGRATFRAALRSRRLQLLDG